MNDRRSTSLASVADQRGRNPNETSKKSASKMGSKIMRAACWTIRSFTVGMPSGHTPPLGLGISTRRTGRGR